MSNDLALSAIDWWESAGVDTLVDDLPRDWLAPAAAPASIAAATQAATPAPLLPATLDGFRAWLLADATVPGPPAQRLDAAGEAASGVMVVVDMPEAGDRAQGTLLGGEPGVLFDRMLGAMGLSRATIYLAPLAPARPASGRLDAAACAALGPLMRHHITLAAPKRLLLLGDAATRALLDLPCTEARGRVHALDAAGHDVPTIASFHPRFLVQTPARKAAAWADLQLFMGLA